ncbi:class I SAM-dependent methyltransferase [Aspergillus candidus]|uniref:S-adenosyl-L-methionine-dependent methyltransferase n=1 Tax=Aspergillus candidus TaxID=41067 RepID=A0A2I2FNC5_ASPCN|nr:S-adenosyl-L-methionine-dependent methyltransferase [Aspergillus candidus]PLB42133.1 S-adenosyl-L-methionine-dependent methyltransferase [Aspergillus candidus]
MPPKPGRLASILRPWGLIWFSICPGNFIAYEDTTIVPSLVQAAGGVVLELGPGPGNQIHRYDTSVVKHVYGVEPNPHFGKTINANLDKHDLRDRYKLIVCGVEDSDVLREEGITEASVDAVLCIQVLCAVKDPKNVMKEVWKLLKPGGKFIFWEHGWSRDRLTGVAQACWNPAWSTFVGCHLTRNVLADILDSGEWENPHQIEEPEEPFSLLPRIQGVLVKQKA